MERAVVGQMLADPAIIGNVVGTLLESKDFHGAGERLLYEVLYQRYYADEPIDALSIGEHCAARLSTLWNCDESAAIAAVQRLSLEQRYQQGDATDHAKVVKRDSDLRSLLAVSASIRHEVEKAEKSPEEIASLVGQDAMQIATSSVKVEEIVQFGDMGREFIREMRRVMDAYQQGIELGAKFGVPFIDDWTHGLQPTELLFAAGEPGVGKSLVWGQAAKRFAERQARLPEDKRIGTLFLSLEMGRWPNYIRIAAELSGVSMSEMRTGELSMQALEKIKRDWGRKKDLPLYFNFASNLRFSQLRALIVESIRRFNVGVVFIDHLRMLDTDHFIRDVNERDEAKVRFLKESIAEDLNVAVVCLAHSVKMTGSDDKRPQMGHLRGSGQIAAHADFVTFIYRPYEYATELAKDSGDVLPTDAEMLWRKNRHGQTGVAEFYFNPETMTIQ
jgi:replicative DNA helicase